MNSILTIEAGNEMIVYVVSLKKTWLKAVVFRSSLLLLLRCYSHPVAIVQFEHLMNKDSPTASSSYQEFML